MAITTPIETIKFSEMTPGGDLSPDNKTPGLLSGENVLFNNPWTFLAPGTTPERPVPSADIYWRLRFNTSLDVYEYYDPDSMVWAQLSGSGTGTVNPGVANDIAFYAANGQAVSPLAGNVNSVLVTDGSGIPSLSAVLPAGLSIPGAIITSSTAALTAGSVVAAPVSGTDLVNKTYVDGLVGSGVQSLTGTTNQIIFSASTGNVTASLPQDIAIGSTPTFAALRVPTFYDANGLIAMTIQTVASQVNYLSVYPQPTGSGPTLAALGSDTDIDLNLLPKGNSSVQILSSNPTNPLIITNGTARQHATNFIMPNTAASRNVTFQDASGTLAFLSDVPAVTPAALTKLDDTNVTLTLGGTPSAALLQATSLTLGWTGQLAVSRGGTGISSFGTGVATALGVNVGSAGAFVTFNGAGGTPSSIALTNGTALPVPGGLSATGTPSSTTFLRGDGTWATPGGSGTVTSVATGGLATGGPITTTGTVTVTAATQSDQETATSTTTAVTPAVQKFHPSSCKFWMNLHGTDTFGINQSYNVSSATDGGVGTYSYNITVAFSAATQCLVVNAFSASGASNNYSVGTTSWATGSGGISLRNMAGTLVDSDNVCIAGFGDQ